MVPVTAAANAVARDHDPVHVHLHYTMRGSYPLRLVDLLFRTETVVVVEYDYLTALDMATGGADRRAQAFARRLTEDGVEAALDAAEHCRTIPYRSLERVTVHDGGRVGREKVALRPAEGQPVTVRVHGDLDVAAFVDALRATLDGYGTGVERVSGLGVDLAGALAALSPR